MGLYGEGNNNALKLAEIIAGVLIAGELSLGCAMFNGDFSKAHQILARDTKTLTIDLEKDDIEDAFIKAQAFLVKLSRFPNKTAILKLYGLYKQTTFGDCTAEGPGLFASIKDKKKFEFWKSFKGMDKLEAKKKYVELAMEIVALDEKKRLEDIENFSKKAEKDGDDENEDNDD